MVDLQPAMASCVIIAECSKSGVFSSSLVSSFSQLRMGGVVKKWLIMGVATLTACAWNPVMTPFAFKDAADVPPAETATIWGMADGTSMYFREVDGKSLPSRGGGGYPISLSLMPGSYSVEIYFRNWDHRYTVVDMPVTVEAGHTYVVDHAVSPNSASVELRLKDLGTTTVCRYDRYDQVRGNAKLVCQ